MLGTILPLPVAESYQVKLFMIYFYHVHTFKAPIGVNLEQLL